MHRDYKALIPFLIGVLVTLLWLNASMLEVMRATALPRASAADGEDANVQGQSVPAGYHYDNVDGTFLTAVASAGSTTATLTPVSSGYASAGAFRTFYPQGRTTFTVWLEGANSAATAVVRFTYWSTASTRTAANYKGHHDVSLAVDGTAPAALNTASDYVSAVSFVDTGAAKSVDVCVVSLTNGPVDVGVGSQ